MSTLLRDLIEIPTQVNKGDFVMSLSEGVSDPTATLRHYVVTEQLVRAYDNALGFVASAVNEQRSKAAYLDGSFGSGKSHFMAVLHLLLQRDPQARAVGELADVIAKHDAALGARAFELVPVHMIGAETMEQRVFDGYLAHLDRVDPGASPPALFADGPIFEQAERLRAAEGDERFLATLNTAPGADAGDGWGDLGAAWTAASYATAAGESLGGVQRARLVGDLIATHLPVMREVYRGAQTGWVDFDLGLAEMARHAAARGSHALVFFLDELILWLGSRMASPEWVAREGQKLIKFIEFSNERAIPIITFVARQRDLREFVDESALGADAMSFADALKHWNDRFHRVELHDRNLPKIAARRLLEPKNEAARQELDAAFAEVQRTRPEVLEVLLTADSDPESFRLTYPFSPAFMNTLVAASSALQRERTALRVMLQLLVDRRDDLMVGDLVSVGDLFDILKEGDEPFADDLRRAFDQARDLYRDQLRPLLEGEHQGDTHSGAFRADDRLVKTLLLASLVSGAASLRDLDIARLTALNHGSIVAPVAGAEKQIVLGKLRRWQPSVPALKVGTDPQNPSVAIRVTGVDVEGILLKAERVDNPGVRRQLVKRLVYAELGIGETGGLLPDEHEVSWRGTRRRVDVVFGNVRDESQLDSDVLAASGDRWKVVLDYPFDAPGHSPDEDVERLDRWRSERPSSRTVCWIPAFFSSALQAQLKRLVIIDHVLEGERLDQFADHLSRADRLQARGILDELGSTLEQRVLTAIRQAYGVERIAPDTIDTSHEVSDRLQALTPEFSAQIPIGARLADAFTDLVRQMLDAQYPQHPRFEDEVKLRDLRLVWEEVQRAADRPDGRLEDLPSDRRRVMRRIANPLALGQQHDGPYVLDTAWKDRLEQRVNLARADGQTALNVGTLRRFIDEPAPLGLTLPVANLLILTYAAQTGRTFRLHGGPAAVVDLDRLDDELELVTAVFPTPAQWARAVERAPAVFGLAAVNPALNPNSVEALAGELGARARPLQESTGALLAVLGARAEQLGVTGDADRLLTAAAAGSLVAAIAADDAALARIEALADAEIPTTAQSLGASLASAAALTDALTDERWSLLDGVMQRAADGDEASERVAAGLRVVFERDEFSAPLAPAITASYTAAVALVLPPTTPKPPPGPTATTARLEGTLAEVRAKLDELERDNIAARAALEWTPRP
ncbi:MAG: hypothetical protein V7607_5874 [Solirubrobacteraceae bacterium]